MMSSDSTAATGLHGRRGRGGLWAGGSARDRTLRRGVYGLTLLVGGWLAGGHSTPRMSVVGLPGAGWWLGTLLALGVGAWLRPTGMVLALSLVAGVWTLGALGQPMQPGDVERWLIDTSQPWIALLAGSALWYGVWLGLLLAASGLQRRNGGPKLAEGTRLGRRSGDALGVPNGSAVAAGIVTGVLGLGLSWALVRNGSVGQSVGGVGIAFFIAALVARLALLEKNIVAMVLSPMVASMVSYGWAAVRFGRGEELAVMLYAGGYSGGGGGGGGGPWLALPGAWASAGVLGVLCGVAVARGVLAGGLEMGRK